MPNAQCPIPNSQCPIPNSHVAEGENPHVTLGELAASAGINLGVAVGGSHRLKWPAFGACVKEFSSVTLANALKIKHVYRQRGKPDYAEADAIANFAESNGMGLRGHLCIGRCGIPSWFYGLNSRRVAALVEKYIKETIARYSHIVTDWDVAVELFDDRGMLRPTLWDALWGKDVFEVLYSWAKEANPEARLFYSDFNLYKYPKQEAVLGMVEWVNREEKLIDGVAIQAHHNVQGLFKLLTAGSFAEQLRKSGLAVQISEVTIWCNSPFPRLFDFKSQAIAYRELFKFAAAHGIKDICIWGANDATAWRHPDKTPFLFDASYRPKPAYAAVREFLIKRAQQLDCAGLDYGG